MINTFTLGITTLYIITGVALVLLTYKAVEYNPAFSGPVAVTATIGTVLLSRHLGRTQLNLTPQQVETAVIAAAIGAGTGIVLTVLFTRPTNTTRTVQP